MLEKSTIANVWNEIVATFTDKPRDVKTAPKIKRKPKWFYVYSDGRDVYVRNAENHKESCVIKGNRRLDGVNANTVYELYLKRKAGVNTAQKENDITPNSSYWFGIFEELGLEH